MSEYQFLEFYSRIPKRYQMFFWGITKSIKIKKFIENYRVLHCDLIKLFKKACGMFNPYLFQFFTQINYVIGRSEGYMYFLSIQMCTGIFAEKSGANYRPRQNWNVLLLKVENNHAYIHWIFDFPVAVCFLLAKHVESLIIGGNHTENQFTNQICIRFQQKIIAGFSHMQCCNAEGVLPV